jgi:hypothetical protein
MAELDAITGTRNPGPPDRVVWAVLILGTFRPEFGSVERTYPWGIVT